MEASTKPIRVLIVDDSKAIGAFLTDVLSRDSEIEVLGQAFDPYEARDMIREHQPDVLTLDVEMPKMDGITFLGNLMRLRPMPVVMLSTLTAQGAETTLDALALGAVDFLEKRNPASSADRAAYIQGITDRVKNAARTQLPAPRRVNPSAALPEPVKEWCRNLRHTPARGEAPSWILAIGASTGGPEAIRRVLDSFYAPSVAVLLVQHMPERFMAPFTARLNTLTRFEVSTPSHLQELQQGHCYVAPGDRHLELQSHGGKQRMAVSDAPPCSGHRPSVDRLLLSVADRSARNTVGVMLTGMGDDGASGMRKLRDLGGLTIVQNKASSAVWGMPGSVVRNGGAMVELHIDSIAPVLTALFDRVGARAVSQQP